MLPSYPSSAALLLTQADRVLPVGERPWSMRAVASALLIAGLFAAESGALIWHTHPAGRQAHAAPVSADRIFQGAFDGTAAASDRILLSAFDGTPSTAPSPRADRVFQAAFDPQAKAEGATTPKADTAARFLEAEKAWQAGRFADASRAWRVLAEERADLEVADWAAKAAARSGDVRTMAEAGSTWRNLAGESAEPLLPLGPNPGLTFFAGLLQKDGYLARTYAPSGLQGAAGPALLEEAYTQWTHDRRVQSHPFVLEAAAQRRLEHPTPLTGDGHLDRWLARFSEERSVVLREFLAREQGTWTPTLHDRLWAEAGPADENAQNARNALKASLTERPDPAAWRAARAHPADATSRPARPRA